MVYIFSFRSNEMVEKSRNHFHSNELVESPDTIPFFLSGRFGESPNLLPSVEHRNFCRDESLEWQVHPNRPIHAIPRRTDFSNIELNLNFFLIRIKFELLKITDC